MKKMLRIVTALVFICSGYAAELPTNCRPVNLKSDNLILKSDNDKLFFIHNVSDADIYLTHVAGVDPGAHAGWTSRINKRRWNVLKLKNRSMVFQCIEYKPGHEQLVSCENNLFVCEIQPIERPKIDEGNYWIAENQSLSAILQTVSRRGFQLIKTEDKAGAT